MSGKVIMKESAAIRAAFESFMQTSAEDAGFDGGPDFARSDECSESYADSHVQAAWYGFTAGVDYLPEPSQVSKKTAEQLSAERIREIYEQAHADRAETASQVAFGLSAFLNK